MLERRGHDARRVAVPTLVGIAGEARVAEKQNYRYFFHSALKKKKGTPGTWSWYFFFVVGILICIFNTVFVQNYT